MQTTVGRMLFQIGTALTDTWNEDKDKDRARENASLSVYHGVLAINQWRFARMYVRCSTLLARMTSSSTRRSRVSSSCRMPMDLSVEQRVLTLRGE